MPIESFREYPKQISGWVLRVVAGMRCHDSISAAEKNFKKLDGKSDKSYVIQRGRKVPGWDSDINSDGL